MAALAWWAAAAKGARLMPGWLDNAFHAHGKRELVPLATDGLLARAISRCGDLLTDGFIEDTWVAKQLLDGMLRPKQRDVVLALALEHRVLERLPAGETRELRGTARAGLRASGIVVPAGPFAVDGYVVHDYLDCNRSRAEVEAIREREAAKKRGQRTRKRQEQLPWQHYENGSQGAPPTTVVSPGESPLKAGDSGDRDRGVPLRKGETVSSHARATERDGALAADPDPVVADPVVADVMAILCEAPRLRVDEIAVRNAVRAFPGADHILAAREVIATVGNDPTRWLTWGSTLLWKALERQTTPAGPGPAGWRPGRRGAPTALDFQALKIGGGAR